jgi:poly(3-hydroxybutyrate) depolymerase
MRFFFAAMLLALPALAAGPLPALRADARGVTVSGLSSGGAMAVQFHVAHSANVSGAGVIAGAPYYCAQNSLMTALYNCMTPGTWTPVPAAPYLKTLSESFAKTNRIDPPGNLSGAPVWLFAGTQDHTVDPAVVRELRRFYELLGAKALLVDDRPAGHAMPTESAGGACAATAPPFLNACGYDAAGMLLRHLLGNLNPPSATAGGRLAAFDQTPFEGAGIDDEGYVFIPKSCEAGGCRVHVAFHGCRQNARAVGERFVREAGYNRWAATNRLIVLYPQAAASYSPFHFNPRGCWDWWGYSGANYATREGAQIRAVKAMLDRLSSK